MKCEYCEKEVNWVVKNEDGVKWNVCSDHASIGVLKGLSFKPVNITIESPIHIWFELSYAQFLTVPRLVMESMPYDWQEKMAELLEEMDATFDWRPKEGRYWVKLRDENGRFTEAPLGDYRRGSCEHLRL